MCFFRVGRFHRGRFSFEKRFEENAFSSEGALKWTRQRGSLLIQKAVQKTTKLTQRTVAERTISIRRTVVESTVLIGRAVVRRAGRAWYLFYHATNFVRPFVL